MDQMTDKYNRKLHDISICIARNPYMFQVMFCNFVSKEFEYVYMIYIKLKFSAYL